MSSTRPTYQQTLDLMRLMADVAAMKGDPPAQRQLLIDELKRIVGTNQALFLVGENWLPGQRARFSHQTLSRDADEGFLRYLAEHCAHLPIEADAFCDHSIHDPSPLQSFSFKSVTPDLAAEKKYSIFTEVRQAGRVTEGIAVMARLDEGRVIGACMHQFGGSKAPTNRQRALVSLAVQEIRGLVKRGHLALPPAQPAEMPPRLRQMLDRLLCGHDAKRIARELDLSIWTVREHISRLYRYYGVSDRAELAAKFIRNNPEISPSSDKG